MTELQQKAGHYNDGVAIEDNMSILIGNQLKEALDNGTFKKFKKIMKIIRIIFQRMIVDNVYNIQLLQTRVV